MGQPVNIKEGLEIIEMGVTKVTRILEGLPESPINSDFYMQQYSNIFNICKLSIPSVRDQVYDKYKLAFMDYLQNTVLPALRQNNDPDILLKELVKRWSNHKVMTRWLSRFFTDLNYHIDRCSLPSLHEVAIRCFHDMVYQEVHDKVTDAILALIRLERDGGQIDQALLKNALDIYMELGTEKYVNDFETPMLNDTTAYYSQKSASWIQEYSYSEYMLKVEECLKREQDRVSHYLHADTESKLLERMQHKLLSVYRNQLLEKQISECYALLKDEKVYQELHDKATHAILTLIRLERDGGQIDQALLKNALDIFTELGAEQYVNDFETPMLNDTAVYYSRKAASWIREFSYSEYMLKVEECLKREQDRVAHYLHADTESKLLERVGHELLMEYENQLLEKESSGLLKDEKVGDISRVYGQLETFSLSHPRSLVMKNKVEDMSSRECIV